MRLRLQIVLLLCLLQYNEVIYYGWTFDPVRWLNGDNNFIVLIIRLNDTAETSVAIVITYYYYPRRRYGKLTTGKKYAREWFYFRVRCGLHDERSMLYSTKRPCTLHGYSRRGTRVNLISFRPPRMAHNAHNFL